MDGSLAILGGFCDSSSCCFLLSSEAGGSCEGSDEGSGLGLVPRNCSQEDRPDGSKSVMLSDLYASSASSLSS